ncbi:hypothetical protein [Curtobacterium sp. VKM Ac-2922]|uniref:DUF6984 family protein n=1 Tax=Curtobacterium sp. VKM Ac-2922 TaxID=2929475 RepID=UPI001FB392B0|nr:hypothetical protein [Curtobacterium sp. VKM Ac-2922]MCJ1714022.1 hypothetical protein [Curtobacterium sp. VKM Ac-2922]
MPRALTGAEAAVVRWLLAHHMPRGASVAQLDLSTAQVARYDESECLRFVDPAASDDRGFSSHMGTFEDQDGVPITAFLTFDQQGRIRELDLWKGDDSPISRLPESFG